MSRHRQKYVDDYDGYDDYDYDDYDGYAKPTAVQKPKPKKNKKKAVPAAAVTDGATQSSLPTPPVASGAAGGSAPPPELSKLSLGAPTAFAAAAPVHSVPSTVLFAGLSDDDGDSARKHARAKGSATEDTTAAMPCLTVIIAGHVDAGKSTLVGNLLFQTGRVSSRVIEAHQREAERSGKASFHFAWVTDESASEREHGVTVSAATK